MKRSVQFAGRLVLLGGVFMLRSVPAQAQSCDWVNKTLTGRAAHAMAFDANRGVTVLFGGLDENFARRGETWEWNGSSWVLRSRAGPSPRAYHAMAFDSARGVTVLFGGWDGDFNGETWEWDGTAWSIRASTGPSPRFGHAMAFDNFSGRTALFGGNTGILSNELWSWNGVVWALVTSTGPTPRQSHAMVFDSNRAALVVWGGFDGGYIGDTWEYRLNTEEWSPRSNDSNDPGASADHAVAYDSVRGATILFGGSSPGARSETWEWNGTTWTRRYPLSPFNVLPRGLAFDSSQQLCVAVTGIGQTWKWDGDTWVARSLSGAPPSCAVAFDSAREVIVAYDGNGRTWEWNGTFWSLRSTAGPSARSKCAIAYDAQRDRTVLFGGSIEGTITNQTWEWDGAAWSIRAPGPEPRQGHALAYDETRGVVVLFGGEYPVYVNRNDTWEYDGIQWTLRGNTGPTPRTHHAMAYDSARGLVVLFGGARHTCCEYYFQLGDTWEWDGTTWTQRLGAEPPPQYGHAMAYDSARRVTILSGDHQTWELENSSPPTISVQPPDQRICLGNSALLAVTAEGATLTYQWYKNGSPIGNATSNTLNVGPVTPSDAGSYYVRIRNDCNSVVSRTATLTVAQPTQLLSQPTGQNVCEGLPIGFSVSADGDALAYAWRRDGVVIPGATTAVLTIDPVTLADAGIYDVVVTGFCSAITSSPVTLSVMPGPVTPVAASADRSSFCIDDAGHIRLSVSGGIGDTVRWFTDACGGSEIGVGNPLMIDSPTTATTYYARWENSCGISGCASVAVSANPPPAVTQQPTNVALCAGGMASFGVVASGVPAPTYQWRRNGSSLTDGGRISGAALPTLTINPALPGDAGNYDVVINNECGTATSDAASLTVFGNPLATAASNSPVYVGEALHLTGGPNGMAGYAWSGPDGFASSAQSPTVSATATLAMGGSYTLTVSDGNGCQGAAATLVRVFMRGDMNCDGALNNFDIDVFILALTLPSSYAQQFPNCNVFNADVNRDGFVDNFDIDVFVALLVGG